LRRKVAGNVGGQCGFTRPTLGVSDNNNFHSF
jgi:hypothetical protein